MAGVIEGIVARAVSWTALRSARPCPTCAWGEAVTTNVASIPVATDSRRARVMDALLADEEIPDNASQAETVLINRMLSAPDERQMKMPWPQMTIRWRVGDNVTC